MFKILEIVGWVEEVDGFWEMQDGRVYNSYENSFLTREQVEDGYETLKALSQ
ncbi:hypothetical protein [Desulfosporosinus sp. FKA]|uniref:hypothetical protein n=1 Tax=Desulfosporosinus sp. FKA TaxID=1969834 RepID=UPI0015580402|nr:hypothetical protein [Desulfosporosinus sp. FKA]